MGAGLRETMEWDWREAGGVGRLALGLAGEGSGAGGDPARADREGRPRLGEGGRAENTGKVASECGCSRGKLHSWASYPAGLQPTPG